MEASNHINKFFIGTAGGYGQYKPEHVTGAKHEEEAIQEQFPVHNPSNETVKRHQNAQVTHRQINNEHVVMALSVGSHLMSGALLLVVVFAMALRPRSN